MNGFVYRASRFTAGIWLRLWNRMRAEGRQNVPAEGGVLLVANHASYLDPPIVGTSIRRPMHFLARSSLAGFRPFGWLLSALGVVFVDRDGSAREGIAGAIRALENGRVVCIFPEGTRTRSGHVEEFKRGALLVLKRAPVPVVPVGIEGSWAALRRGMVLPRPARIRVRYGPTMSAAEVLADGGVEELRRRVRALARDVPPAPDADSKNAAPEPVTAGSRGDRAAAGTRREDSGARSGSSMSASSRTVFRPSS